MEAEGKELTKRNGDNHSVVSSSSQRTSSTLPETARELFTQPTNSTPLTNAYVPCPLHKYQQRVMRDPPPAYAEATCDVHKNRAPRQTPPREAPSISVTRKIPAAELLDIDDYKTYLQRSKICKRFTMVVVFLFAFAGFYLMHWNKQLIERSARNQEEALRNVVSVAHLNASRLYEGKLVHVSGPLSISEPLTDDECGFALSSVKMRRFVHSSEIYMMIKSKRDCDDPSENEPRYYYTRKGGDTLLNSNQMCVNPKYMLLNRWDVKNQIQTAKEVKIGSLIFGPELKDKFNEFAYVTDKLMELNNGNVVRLMFSYAGKEGDTYSVIGKLTNGVIVPYTTVEGDEILFKRKSIIPAEVMIRSRQYDLDFEFCRRSYIMSLAVMFLCIPVVYYCKVRPRPTYH